jgi:putative ABC transport system substrate-binding protein
MNRRAFIALASVTATLRAGPGSGQPGPRIIGILDTGNPDAFLSALRKALGGLGQVEGKDIGFEARGGEGSAEILRQRAEELVNLKVDIIAVRLTPALRAAMAATKTIPIVMAGVGGPLEVGLVPSLSRPGGNVTGMSMGGIQLTGKRLQLMRETVPSMRRLAFVSIPGDSYANRYAEIMAQTMAQEARSVGIETVPVMVSRPQDLDSAIGGIAGGRPDAILALANVSADTVAAVALKHRLPVFATQRFVTDAGGLMSYGGRLDDQYRGAAIHIDKILKGALPANLPIEEPSRFELVINVKTANALGIVIPASVVAQADELIE